MGYLNSAHHLCEAIQEGSEGFGRRRHIRLSCGVEERFKLCGPRKQHESSSLRWVQGADMPCQEDRVHSVDAPAVNDNYEMFRQMVCLVHVQFGPLSDRHFDHQLKGTFKRVM